MLNPEERYALWDNYREKISDLRNDIETDLWHMTPYAKPEDEDTPNAKKLFGILDKLHDFVKLHCDELYKEYVSYSNEQQNLGRNFDAWFLGLCPNVLQKERVYFWSDLEEIAALKTSREISQEDTQNAVNIWRANSHLWRETA